MEKGQEALEKGKKHWRNERSIGERARSIRERKEASEKGQEALEKGKKHWIKGKKH